MPYYVFSMVLSCRIAEKNGQDKTQVYKMQTLFPLLACFEDVVT